MDEVCEVLSRCNIFNFKDYNKEGNAITSIISYYVPKVNTPSTLVFNKPVLFDKDNKVKFIKGKNQIVKNYFY